jgi:hypothetical protein
MSHPRRLAGPLAIAVLVAACSGAAAPPSIVQPSATPPTLSDPISTSPDQPGGIVVPPGGGALPGPGSGGDPEVPKPGQLDIHPVAMTTLTASVSGHHVVIRADWVSGVEPCSTLDSILVATGPGTFSITIREGHGAEQVMCIDIAKFKHALIDLGDLAPGTYSVTDSQSGATPIQVVVS